VSSFCSSFSFWWMLMITGLWHVCHLFLLLSSLCYVCIPFFLHAVGIHRPWWDGWMTRRMDKWMKWCFTMSFTICNTIQHSPSIGNPSPFLSYACIIQIGCWIWVFINWKERYTTFHPSTWGLCDFSSMDRKVKLSVSNLWTKAKCLITGSRSSVMKKGFQPSCTWVLFLSENRWPLTGYLVHRTLVHMYRTWVQGVWNGG
jgi:hypothetical protein